MKKLSTTFFILSLSLGAPLTVYGTNELSEDPNTESSVNTSGVGLRGRIRLREDSQEQKQQKQEKMRADRLKWLNADPMSVISIGIPPSEEELKLQDKRAALFEGHDSLEQRRIREEDADVKECDKLLEKLRSERSEKQKRLEEERSAEVIAQNAYFEYLPGARMYHRFSGITISPEERVWLGENDSVLIEGYKSEEKSEEKLYYHIEWTQAGVKILDIIDLKKYKRPFPTVPGRTDSHSAELLKEQGVDFPLAIQTITDASPDGKQIAGMALDGYGCSAPFKAQSLTSFLVER